MTTAFQPNAFQNDAFQIDSTGIGWLQPLSKPALIVAVQVGYTSVPFNTVQINTQRIDKWLVPLSKPVLPVAYGRPGYSVVPFNTAQINTQRIDKWLVPLSKPVPVARVVNNFSVVPLNTVQVNPAQVTYDKYQQPLSIAVRAVKAQQGFITGPFSSVNIVTADEWQQPLSVAVLRVGPKYTQPSLVVIPSVVPTGWQQALSIPLPTKKSIDTNQSLPIYIVVTDSNINWQSPLSIPPSVTKVIQGFVFVPSDTAQFVPPATADVIHSIPFLATMGCLLTR